LLIVGDVLFDEGDYEGAKKKFEDALRVFREIGAQKSIRASLERIGNVYYSEGQLRESLKFYEQALRFDQEINSPWGLASDYGNMANAFDGLGDLRGSLRMQQKSLAAFNEIGDRRGAASTLNNIGNLLVETGNLEEAKQYFERALSLDREIAHLRGEPYPIAGLGDSLLAQGDLAGARKQYEHALALCKETNDEDLMSQLDVSLAVIALAEKRYSDGEALARKAAAGYEKANSAGNEAWAQAVLSRNLLGAGDLQEAQTAAKKAVSLSQRTTGQTPRYEAQLADALVKAKSGKLAEARRELESVLASARRFGYRAYEYQARLALCEIELWSGTASASARLTSLESDARAQGLLLVANQAHAISKPNK
jgi:tetratricopeptide (TPR) repeat protein